MRKLIGIFFIAFACCAFQVPTTSEYEHVTDYRNKVQESDIENSRTANPTRKASENKRPWDNESFFDMEGYVSPGFDSWEWPEFAGFDPWDVAPAPLYGPDDIILPIWHMAGCGFSRLIKITDCELEYDYVFRFLHGVVVRFKVSGPVADSRLDASTLPTKIVVQPLPNATDGSIITIEAWTRSLKKGQVDGYCKTTTRLYCAECECLDFIPDIYASGPTIEAGGSITMYVDSGGLACPPYKWTVSGTGYTLSTNETDNDLETVTLTSASGT